MTNSTHNTADAIERLDDLLQILRELNAVPSARPHVIGLQFDVQLMRDVLALTFTNMNHQRRKWLRKMEQRVNSVDAAFRPLG